jgi:hypothetical protein
VEHCVDLFDVAPDLRFEPGLRTPGIEGIERVSGAGTSHSGEPCRQFLNFGEMRSAAGMFVIDPEKKFSACDSGEFEAADGKTDGSIGFLAHFDAVD